MGRSDGEVLSRESNYIVFNGPPERKWNIVILGDGFRRDGTVDEIPVFESAAQSIANTLLSTPPFNRLRSAINIYRVNVRSDQSGADDPLPCGGSGATPRTFFDAQFCVDGIRRGMAVDNGLALEVARQAVPQAHVVLVLVNSMTSGGMGGGVARFSLAQGFEQVAIHEIGHTYFGLADEYEYWQGCGMETDRDVHGFTLFDLVEPNVTVHEDLNTLKWRRFVTPGTSIPTTRNPNCTMCDSQPNPSPPGTIGLYEGAHYYHCDAYRPEFDCMMRNTSAPFCRVCREHIMHRLEPFLGGRLSTKPSAVLFDSTKIGVFYRGEDDQLVWRAFEADQWFSEEVFDGRHSTSTSLLTSAPSVVSGWRGLRFAVFYRGPGDRLRWKAHDGNRWHNDAEVEGHGTLHSEPAVVQYGDNNLGVFYRRDDRLVWRACEGGRWHNEESFDDQHVTSTGRLTSAPAVVSGWRGFRFAVFYRGEGDRLRWKAHDGNRWHNDAEVERSGILTSAPTVAVYGSDNLGVFYRGQADRFVWRAFQEGRWYDEEIFDERHPIYTNRLTSAPAVVSNWSGFRFAAFYSGDTDRLRWMTHNGSQWFSEMPVG
jgi:hypothetical protein